MRINFVVKTLILSDFYINTGLGFFAPIYAVFITEQIQNGSLAAIGLAVAIGQILKSVLEIPISWYLDRKHGERAEYYSLMIGNILISSTPFMFLLASQMHHIYIIEAIFGVGVAFAVPPWHAIFSRHLDKRSENLEWSFKSIEIGLATAGSAAIGGYLADRFGFPIVFVIAGFVTIAGTYFQSKIYKGLKKNTETGDKLHRTHLEGYHQN